jgi:hypothetical protein
MFRSITPRVIVMSAGRTGKKKAARWRLSL